MKPRIGRGAATTAGQERRRWTAAGSLVAVAGVAAAGIWALLLSDNLSAALLGPALVAVASVVLGVVIALAPFNGRPRGATRNDDHVRTGTKEERK